MHLNSFDEVLLLDEDALRQLLTNQWTTRPARLGGVGTWVEARTGVRCGGKPQGRPGTGPRRRPPPGRDDWVELEVEGHEALEALRYRLLGLLGEGS